jgi:hypothetical protein
VKARLFHAHKQRLTDRTNKTIAFGNLANAPKKQAVSKVQNSLKKKLMVAQIANIFPVYNGNLIFLNVFTTASH